MENYSFSTQITVFDMYRFQLRHTYCCVSGFISILMSIACLVLLALKHDDFVYTTNILLLLGGACFIVLMPFNILWKSYKIIALTPSFKKPLDYLLDNEGVHVSQDGETADLPWEAVIKIIETKTQIVIYNSPKNGFILPKKQLGDKVEDIKTLASAKVSDYCVVKMK